MTEELAKTETTKQATPPELRNPTGIGGFGDHPENRSNGKWDKTKSIGYQLNKFLRMNELDVKDYRRTHKNMTMAELGALSRIVKMIEDLKEFQEVANRTEGMPKQHIDMDIDEEIRDIKIEVIEHKLDIEINETKSDDNIQKELSGISEKDKIDSQSGGQGIKQDLVASPTVPDNTAKPK